MPPDIDVHLLPTGQTPAMRYNDFTRSVELVRVAYEATSDYLAGRPAVPEMPAGTPEPSQVATGAGAASTGNDDRHAPQPAGDGTADVPPSA
jgi:hypothetical protein